METEKLQNPIKIIKKHLKADDFNSDVYILNYQIHGEIVQYTVGFGEKTAMKIQ